MRKLLLTLASIFILTACGSLETARETATDTTPIPDKVVNDISLTNDWDGATIEKKDLLNGCPSKDCIPSIDAPSFKTATSADSWLNDDDRIFVGVKRAYPQRIMNWHEIVNDEFDGEPVTITFCPLCGSSIAFKRKANGVITKFGVSGKLHNSDLTMYDRYEGSLWQQISGEAIVGPAAQRDEVLAQVPLTTTTWGEWKTENPDTDLY